MHLEYVPLLQIQRDLHEIPRGFARFEKYLRVVGARGTDTMQLPSLLYMNPMGREHVTALLDTLLALDAERIAEEAVASAAEELGDEPGAYKVGLVIADDLKGGWTNRVGTECSIRFPDGPIPPGSPKLPRWLKEHWITGVLWSSEPASERAVRETIRTAIFRTAYLARHGRARTLRERLVQEGRIMAQARCEGPVLDEDDREYTRAVLEPMLDTSDMRTTMECLFGDALGRTLGLTPQGLSPWAGLALALHDANTQTVTTKLSRCTTSS